MRYIPIIATLFVLTACSTRSPDAIRAVGAHDTPTVTYYDRNKDGVADLELHQPGYCDDCEWALVDTDFSGRYDKRVRWSFGLIKEVVDMPVARHVPLTSGQPELSGWED